MSSVAPLDEAVGTRQSAEVVGEGMKKPSSTPKRRQSVTVVPFQTINTEEDSDSSDGPVQPVVVKPPPSKAGVYATLPNTASSYSMAPSRRGSLDGPIEVIKV